MSRTIRIYWSELAHRSAEIQAPDDLGDLTPELRAQLVDRAVTQGERRDDQVHRHPTHAQVAAPDDRGQWVELYPELPAGAAGDAIACAYVTTQADVDHAQAEHDQHVSWMRATHGAAAHIQELRLPTVGAVCGRDVLYDEQRWEYTPLREWVGQDDDDPDGPGVGARLGESRYADGTHGWSVVECEAGHQWREPRFDYGF